MTTDALIIKENNNIGEADRFVTALTRDLGIVRASARGANNIKSRNAAATRLLSYSRLKLIRGRDKYIIEDAKPITVFFELREDIEKLTLAQYFCELIGVLAPQEEPAEDFLRLMLNALHFLIKNDRDSRLVKAVFELRLLGMAGFAPDLTACSVCGAFVGEKMWLLPERGRLVCGQCSGHSPSGNCFLLSSSTLSAMRHVLYSEFDKCFSFTMSEKNIAYFSEYTEKYMLTQLGRGFKTLDFYHMSII